MLRTSTFIPLLRVPHKRIDGYSEAGVPRFVVRGTIAISPIRLETTTRPTSIRTDKSGSKSNASEQEQIGRILVERTAELLLGDILTIYSQDWRIVGIYPRYEMNGQIHHLQVDLSAWV